MITPAIPSTAATLALVLLVLALAALFVRAVAVASRRNVDAPVQTCGLIVLALGALVLNLGGTWLVARSGMLLSLDARPPRIMVLMGAVTILTLGVAFSPLGTRLARNLSLASLIGYQVFRVLVELLLAALHHQGVMPRQMTFEGRNFDILSGISAAIVASMLARGRLPRWGAVAWNLAGLALLLNIVVLAILSTPFFDNFPGEPRNTAVLAAPWIWLPSILVQAALFGHVLVLRRLLHDERG